jgi:hypothetical protein
MPMITAVGHGPAATLPAPPAPPAPPTPARSAPRPARNRPPALRSNSSSAPAPHRQPAPRAKSSTLTRCARSQRTTARPRSQCRSIGSRLNPARIQAGGLGSPAAPTPPAPVACSGRAPVEPGRPPATLIPLPPRRRRTGSNPSRSRPNPGVQLSRTFSYPPPDPAQTHRRQTGRGRDHPIRPVREQSQDGQRTDRSDVLLEICQVSADTVECVVARSARMIAAHYVSGIRGLLFRGVGELPDNAVSHGASPCGARMAAQAYTPSPARSRTGGGRSQERKHKKISRPAAKHTYQTSRSSGL